MIISKDFEVKADSIFLGNRRSRGTVTVEFEENNLVFKVSNNGQAYRRIEFTPANEEEAAKIIGQLAKEGVVIVNEPNREFLKDYQRLSVYQRAWEELEELTSGRIDPAEVRRIVKEASEELKEIEEYKEEW